jgi:hypothetical protein
MRVHIVMLHLNQIFRIIYKYTIIKYIYIYILLFLKVYSFILMKNIFIFLKNNHRLLNIML